MTMADSKISRADLEAKFREVQDGLQGKLQEKKTSILGAVAVAGVVLVVVFFLLGRRSGRKKTTLVEIRRV
ncbi:MAG TPA: hypothetical protein VMS14_01015 [Ilumatobacteraceae bacterium]|nr:hypothetical protein [Ilumatobacteraceae bacterium]